MKRNLALGLITLGSIIFTPVVNAQGNATVEFRNNCNIQVGDTFTVEMVVTDIIDTYDGVVSMGGNLSFDKEMVKYVSSEATEKPYLFQINEGYNYKIAGLDFTLDNGIKEDTVVYTFTFEALKEGTTEITFINQKLTDSQSYIDTNVEASAINILSVSKEEIQDKVVINEEKKIIKQDVTDIKVNKSNISNVKSNDSVKEKKINPNMVQFRDVIYKLIKLFR